MNTKEIVQTIESLGFKIEISEERQEFWIMDDELNIVRGPLDYTSDVYETCLRAFLLDLKNHGD